MGCFDSIYVGKQKQKQLGVSQTFMFSVKPSTKRVAVSFRKSQIEMM